MVSMHVCVLCVILERCEHLEFLTHLAASTVAHLEGEKVHCTCISLHCAPSKQLMYSRSPLDSMGLLSVYLQVHVGLCMYMYMYMYVYSENWSASLNWP